MLTVPGGVKLPSGNGLSHWGNDVTGAIAQGMPKPTPRSDFPPRAACGAFAPSVTSVPAGSGQGAVEQVEVVRGPSRGTVCPKTTRGLFVVGSRTTGGSVLASGIRCSSATPRKTPVRPVAFRAAATALYFAVKTASGVAVTPSMRNPAPPAARMSFPMIPRVMNVGFKERAWVSCDPFPRKPRSARAVDAQAAQVPEGGSAELLRSLTSPALAPGIDRLS